MVIAIAYNMLSIKANGRWSFCPNQIYIYYMDCTVHHDIGMYGFIYLCELMNGTYMAYECPGEML